MWLDIQIKITQDAMHDFKAKYFGVMKQAFAQKKTLSVKLVL
jgi:hypothetical protein